MRLNISLTRKGDIQKAIKELQKYKQSLNSKGEIFLQRLAEVGIPVIDARIARAQGDSDPRHYTHIEVFSYQDYSEAHLVVEGQGLIWFEFGAGVHYNGAAGSSPRKSEHGTQSGAEYNITGGEELGYTIGSYGKGQGKNDHWFYYADNGDVVMSHGTEATMPMYHATMEILNSIRRIAKEVYGNG